MSFRTRLFQATVFLAFSAFTPLVATAQTAQSDTAALSPQAEALKSALLPVADTGLFTYYQSTDFKPVFAGNAARLTALLNALSHADEQGLPVQADVISALRGAMAQAGLPARTATLEELAASAYVVYATELTSGLLNPNDISDLIDFDTVRPTPEALLAKAAASDGSGALYAALEPQDPSYNALQAELARLKTLVKAGGWGPKIPGGSTLRPGHSGSRVQAMRARLAALGYDGTDGDSPRYDKTLVAAVKAFQGDKGLTADGIVGPQTLIALNADASFQMQQVIVNMERRRWLNYDLGARHILVNQAGFMAYVVDYGLTTLATRVVVGKTDDKYQTPEFIDQMTHMIVNPSWNVPESIAAQEYLPQVLRDPSVLTRQNITMRVPGSDELVDARLIDMSQYTEQHFPFILQQLPGNRNALGRVKFMFPNKYNVYLHDTPSRSLFGRDSRAFSHGCVRVQRPLDLAYTLLAPQTDDPEGVFKAALDSGSETQIDLKKPVPIYLTYQSVYLDETGALTYRVDVYGRDTLVFKALAEKGVTLPEQAS